MTRDPNRCPTHPGVFLERIVLPSLGVTKNKVAEDLGLSRQQFHAIRRGRQPITPKTAVLLEKLVGRSAQAWLNMQNAYDVWQIERTADLSSVEPLPLRQAV